MTNIDLQALGITKDELIDRVVANVSDQVYDESSIREDVVSGLSSRVDDLFQNDIVAKVDQMLSDVMRDALDREVTPCDIWGEPIGNPTTIRAAISNRARDFWTVKVNSEGRPTEYSGKPRHEWMIEKVAREEFEKGVKANTPVIVEEFKKAMREESLKWVSAYIDKTFKK